MKDHCYDYLKFPISEENGHRDSLPTDAIYLTFKVIGYKIGFLGLCEAAGKIFFKAPRTVVGHPLLSV